MKINHIKILTDENISPRVVNGLRQIGIDVLILPSIWVIEETRIRIRHFIEDE